MKNTILFFVLLFSLQLIAQDKFYTKSGKIVFQSSVPSFEEVKATNNKVTVILKDDGTIASLALVKAFRFKVALMEEHFNENYMDSDQYPKTTFSGKIANFSVEKLTNKFKEYTINGKLTIKNSTKKIAIKSNIKILDGVIHLAADFVAIPEDYGIKIPKIVRNKIAKQVDISLDFQLKKK